MSSYNSMLKSLEPASSEDVEAYRAWLEKHEPIEARETRFIERNCDLVEVRRRRSASVSGGGSAGPYQRAAVGLPLMAVLPVVAVAMVPSLLGRLLMVVVIGTAEAMLVTSTELVELMTQREWFICASM